ncbi:MAG TPA: hypothetical protein PKY96_00980, partial [Flavobacteriales bacterium]|nr:hypothetical protein [Flavobacteriales bacterium]
MNNHLSDITKYQGELIVVGKGPRVNGRHGVYHLVNGEWQLFNGGITGLVSRPTIMSIYQGVLFLGGQIREAEGNVGHGLISWNGSEYQNVGGGLKWAPNDDYTLTGVTTLEVHDDLLFVAGGFLYAGYHPTQGFVTWNGTRWCDVQGD